MFVPLLKESNYLLEAHEPDRAWVKRYRLEQVECLRRQGHCADPTSRACAQVEHFDVQRVDDDWYRAVFAFAGDGEIAGEVCPSYLGMPEACIEHAVRLNPALRVVVLVRDPVDRFWSQVRMNTRYGLIDRPIDALLGDRKAMDVFMRYSDYAGSIERWSRRLRPGHLLCVPYDDIARRPRDLATRILRFLGVEEVSVRGEQTRVNIGQAMEMTPRQRERVLGLMEPQYAYLRGRFPQLVDRWFARHREVLAVGTGGDNAVER